MSMFNMAQGFNFSFFQDNQHNFFRAFNTFLHYSSPKNENDFVKNVDNRATVVPIDVQ